MADQIFIAELSTILDRDARTIRCWVRDARRISEVLGKGMELPASYLPRTLWPASEDNGRKRIFWSPDQVDGLKEFAAEKDRRKGWQGSTAQTQPT